METTNKLHPGQELAPETFKRLDGANYTFGAPGKWQALFVFRGRHCPICKAYLSKIETRRESLEKLGVEIAAVSADDEGQTRATADATKARFPLLYGMDVATMQRLGFYISEPRSSAEPNHQSPDPALLVCNPEGVLQIVDVANAPFVRPELDTLIAGLAFVIDKNYPIRGTHR